MRRLLAQSIIIGVNNLPSTFGTTVAPSSNTVGFIFQSVLFGLFVFVFVFIFASVEVIHVNAKINK